MRKYSPNIPVCVRTHSRQFKNNNKFFLEYLSVAMCVSRAQEALNFLRERYFLCDSLTTMHIQAHTNARLECVPRVCSRVTKMIIITIGIHRRAHTRMDEMN